MGFTDIVNTVASVAGEAGKIGAAKRQHKRQKELMNIQHRNQQALNQQGADLAYDMWNKTNYDAQLAKLKEAGLSPGLMYGLGGAGGSTTSAGSGGSAAGGQASSGQFMDMSNILAARKLEGELNLMAAQEDKVRAEAEKLRGVDTELTAATADKMRADVRNINSEAELRAFEIKYADQLKQLDIELGYQNIDESKQRIEESIQNVAKSKQDVIESQSRVHLQGWQSKLAEANINKAEAETVAKKADVVYQEWVNDKLQEYDLDPRSPATTQLLQKLRTASEAFWNTNPIDKYMEYHPIGLVKKFKNWLIGPRSKPLEILILEAENAEKNTKDKRKGIHKDRRN